MVDASQGLCLGCCAPGREIGPRQRDSTLRSWIELAKSIEHLQSCRIVVAEMLRR
jgi:hypothetical protein